MSNPEDTNFADMGDDAFEALLTSGGLPEEAPVEESLTESEEATDESLPDDGEELETESTDDEGTDDEQSQDEETEQGEETDDEAEEESDSTDKSEETESTELDPQLQELFAPFKASGSEMQVKSVDEARTLMKMGVDYQGKMRDLKPHRRTIRTLADNGIDEAQLNHLIDISNGDKAAIAKLIKDKGIETFDLESEENSSYAPSNHHVSEEVVELEEVVASINTTPSFAVTSDVISNQWDQASRQAIMDNPQYLVHLNEHVANGVYDRVKQEVTRQRAFGGLTGLSDIQAYDKVGQSMAQSGAFNAPAQPPKVVKTAPTKASNNTDKKRRASPAKRISKAPAPKHDFANMSDEEFEKLL